MELKRHARLVIHDMEPADFERQFPDLSGSATLLAEDQKISQCLGCFGCWVKTPGKCVLKDEYNRIAALFDEPTEEIVLISKCVYGGYSPFVKNVMDRSIGFMLPFFTMHKDELHHQPRVKSRPRFTVHFYGPDITAAERKTAEELVRANSLNLNISTHTVLFHNRVEEMEGSLI